MNLKVKFYPEHLQVIKKFILTKVAEAHAEGVVVGLSGGLDSAVVLNIASEIFNVNKVSAVFLPESTTPKLDAKHARQIAKDCAVELIEIGIDEILRVYLSSELASTPGPIALGNLKARIRMNILYLIANSQNRLVLGTSNKSEFLLGYFTKYGDGGSDVAPMGDLFKTQVRALAKHLKLPDEVISKPPTAGLIEDQTDEDELGLNYATIDKILFGLERDISISTLVKELKLTDDDIFRIKNRVENNRHKRKFTKIPKLGLKTIGVDLYE